MTSKNLLAKIILLVLVGSSLMLPVAAMAAQDSGGNSVSYSTPSLWPTGYWGPLVWCTGNYLSNGQVANPDGTTPPSCTSLCDLIGTFINVIYFAMSIGIFIVTPISLVIGSIMVMISGANPEMLGTGKKVLFSTVIGLAIVLCSYLLVATAISVLGITGVGGFNASACG